MQIGIANYENYAHRPARLEVSNIQINDEKVIFGNFRGG